MTASANTLVSPPRILVALDYDSKDACLNLVDQLDPAKCRLKVGKQMFTLYGPQLVETLQAKGFDVFLDLKFHDIPNTVAKAVAATASLGVWMVNVHASGGQRMMEAAVESLQSFQQSPLLIGVTVLTSMDHQDLAGVGIQIPPPQQVINLANLAKTSGLHGVVCSAQEAGLIKEECGSEFLTVTPGIRPANATGDDQRRVMTPKQAIQNGSDYLVIGRPITASPDPLGSLNAILAEI